jgi:hypothetical protein
MAIDWTPIEPEFNGTGNAEYRQDNDGLVRWRGEVILGADATYGYFLIPVPLQAIASIRPAYWDYAVGRRGLITDGATFYFSLAGGNPTGTVIDLAGVIWQGIPPPVVALDHSLENVLAGLKESLENIAKLRVYDFPSSKVDPPAAVLSLPETPYDVTLGGRSDVWTFPVWVLVSKADDRSAYKEMIPYLDAEGERSIRAMIEADRTLGGACDTCAVVNARPQFASVGGVEFLAIEFTLEVFT